MAGLRKIPPARFIEDRDKFIEDECRGKTVLHLGCASAIHWKDELEDKRFLHKSLVSVASEIIGIDLDSAAIETLQALHPDWKLIRGDCENLDASQVPAEARFERVIGGELIEHLNNPGLFLKAARRHMTRESVLVLTTPNMLSLKLFLFAMRGTQRIHPDHSLGFTFSLLETLLSRFGFEVAEWTTCNENYTSAQRRWNRRIFSRMGRLFPRFADTIVLKAQISDAQDGQTDLTA